MSESCAPPLLAARLDQLEPAERSVLERGAVEGEIFHRGAVQALSEGGPVTPRLASLVRKDLIRPDRAQLSGDDAFRFRHLLIRDAAYEALPKAVRARLHESFGVWRAERGGDLVELDEILGFHFEQAVRYKAELGQPDPALAERAGERLAAARRRARGDTAAAGALLERALELTRPLRVDVHLELDLSDVQLSPHDCAAIAERAAERARASGDHGGAALARLWASAAKRFFTNEPSLDELERLATDAVPPCSSGLRTTSDSHGLGTRLARSRCGAGSTRRGPARRSKPSATGGQRVIKSHGGGEVTSAERNGSLVP